ncbi:MAG: penicillin-binding transpeptidase domain-containing protein [Nitriliruptoraceae bacterium]
MRFREVLALLVGLAVVGGLGYLGYEWFLTRTDPQEQEDVVAEGAAEVVDTYLTAWSAGDTTTMQEQLTDPPPEDFARRHEQLAEALQPTSFAVTAGTLSEPADGRAEVDVTVAVTPADAPRPVEWETTLQLSRSRGVWTVDWSLSTLHPQLRPAWEFATETEEVARRPILAADGTELASDDGRWLGFVPGTIEDPERVVAAFERALPGTGEIAERELNRGELVDDWFYPVVVVSRERAEAAWTTLRRTSGIAEPRDPPEGQRRTLLDLGFARHLVGVIAEATAEQLEELEAEGIEAPVGTYVPQFGLEALFDDQLTGSEVFRVGLREVSGGAFTHTIDEVQAEPSAPVETTIDVGVQRAVENTLAGVDGPAAIVAVDGTDGAIRGTASRPLFGFDRARAGRYPPGSTFKLVTLEAALAAGYDLDDEVACPARSVVGGLAVTNSGDRDLGTVTLGEAFAASCNTTFAVLGAELGADALEASAQRFGFDEEPLHPLGAFGGSFPAPADTAEVAAAAFGQARVEASPLHLAAMVAAVTEGVWHQPYVLADDGPGSSEPLATGAADRLRTALELAVVEGTGELAAIEEGGVSGKTGTAQADGGSTEHAWFVGTYDGLGFAILVEGGGSGAEVAAPLAARLAAELQRFSSGEVDPTDPLEAAPIGSDRTPEPEGGTDGDPEVLPEDEADG